MTAMTSMTNQPASNSNRHRSGTLYDVLELILDKGLVIDIYVRVGLVGIELLTIDARIVVASVDTYLHFAEAVNRLDLTQTGDAKPLDEFIGGMTEKGARGKTRGAVSGVTNAISEGVHRLRGDDDDDDSNNGRQPARRRPAEDRPRRRRPAEAGAR
ncbi:gas vesicle protein GvpJ [Jatrophihabitans sp.]|uniref:gas vesicle protein GvpJ n=1 Tax=Jatrophihabitans sp. TaxID=1932789 RepID=UPI002C2D9452|nr:gas vesicle protein GvpJ [Jatrophihabitans sp.]